MTTELTAFDHHVLARLIDKTQSLLHLPKNLRQWEAEVIDVGYGVPRIKVGDRILYKTTASEMARDIVAQESGVYIDEENGIISVHCDQIFAKQLPNDDLIAHDDHVIAVKIEEQRDTTLTLPDSMKTKRGWARVVHVGHGVERVEVGDEIVWKDSAVFVGGAVVKQEHAVILDAKKGIVAIQKRQIVGRRRRFEKIENLRPMEVL